MTCGVRLYSRPESELDSLPRGGGAGWSCMRGSRRGERQVGKRGTGGAVTAACSHASGGKRARIGPHGGRRCRARLRMGHRRLRGARAWPESTKAETRGCGRGRNLERRRPGWVSGAGIDRGGGAGAWARRNRPQRRRWGRTGPESSTGRRNRPR